MTKIDNRIRKIYGLFDPETNELRYIGVTVCSLKKRLKDHRNDKNINYRTKWIKSLKEKGLEPQIVLLDEVSAEEWIFWEQWHIAYWKSLGCRLTNGTIGGDAPMLGKFGRIPWNKGTKGIMPGTPISEEHKERLRAIHLGSKLTEEHKDKISKSLIGNQYAKGFKHTEETKRKVSEAGKGRKMSEDWCRKLSERKKGNKNRIGCKNTREHQLKLIIKSLSSFDVYYKVFELKENDLNNSQIAKQVNINETTVGRILKHGLDYYKTLEKEIENVKGN